MKILVNTILYKTSPTMLRAWLSSVAGSRGVELEVVIVDNAPEAGTADLIAEFLPAAHYLLNQENVGFARAVNQSQPFWTDHDALLLLNPDVECGPNDIANLGASLGPGVGVVSSALINPDGTEQRGVRRLPTFWDQLAILLKLPHIWPGVVNHYLAQDLDLKKPQAVESIMGAVMLISREAINKVGWFDGQYFLWFEEVDYCARTLKAGLLIKHVPSVTMTHARGVSFGLVGTWTKQRWVRQSMRKYARKHWGVLPWLALWLAVPLAWLAGFVAGIIKKR
jgi:N-acetylglucosaminyl-diphospho-decaprenol L-rhamnosyltransferase